MVVSKRYRILRQLGEGGMGVVYEALDTHTDRHVALKTLRPALANPRWSHRLKREFRVLSDFQHPHVVRYFELYEEEQSYYFTMELVRGKRFDEFVLGDIQDPPPSLSAEADSGAEGLRASSASPLPFDTVRERRLRHACAQLADALHGLHESGHVHQDLKPSNVLVEPSGRLVLLDFGLSRPTFARRVEADGTLSGTPLYLAPEHAQWLIPQRGPRRRRTSPRDTLGSPAADWYAFGVLLYLGLTSTPPFVGSQLEVLRDKCERDAPSPRDVSPTAPEELALLCQALLSRNPDKRPKGEEVLAALGTLRAPSSFHPSIPVVAPFVGRTREWTQLENALDEALRGKGVLVFLEGEAGIGKTRLARTFLDHAESSGFRVFRGRSYEFESMPWKGLDALMDDLVDELERLPASELVRLVPGGLPFLATLFPSLLRIPTLHEGHGPPDGSLSPSDLRHHAFEEWKTLLTGLRKRQPLALFLDDLHWSDDGSLEALGRLLEPPTPGIFVLCTLRKAQDSDALAALRASATTLVLEGLAPEEAKTLWESMGSKAPSTAFRWSDTAGHPFYITELARTQFEVPTPQGKTDSSGLRTLLLTRVHGLTSEARDLCELLALASIPLPARVLSAATPMGRGDFHEAQDHLRRQRFVTVRAVHGISTLEFVHDRMREAVLAALDESTDAHRSELHLRLGRAMVEDAGSDHRGSMFFNALRHLNHARDHLTSEERDALAQWNLEAGKAARLATDYGLAETYLRAARDLLGPRAWEHSRPLAHEIHREHWIAIFRLQHYEQADEDFEALLRRSPEPSERADLYITKVDLETGHSRFAEALATARRALQELGESLPARGTVPRFLFEWARLSAQLRNDALATLHEAPQLETPRLAAIARLYLALSPAAFFTDRLLLAIASLRAIRIGLRHGVCDGMQVSLAAHGMVLSGAFQRYKEATAFMAAAARLGDRFQHPRYEGQVRFLNGGFCLPYVRPLEETFVELSRAAEVARQSGDTTYESFATTLLAGMQMFVLSDLPLARKEALASIARNQRLGVRDMEAVSTVHVRWIDALTGAIPWDEALSQDATPLRRLLDEAHTPSGLFHHAFWMASLAYLFGDFRASYRFLLEAQRRHQAVFGVIVLVPFRLFQVLTAAALREDPNTGPLEKAHLRRMAVSACRKLRTWSLHGDEFFGAYTALAEARFAAQGAQSLALHQRAIDKARALPKPSLLLALSLEATAKLSFHQDKTQAASLRAEAAAAYRALGAPAKAATLTDS